MQIQYGMVKLQRSGMSEFTLIIVKWIRYYFYSRWTYGVYTRTLTHILNHN